MMKAYSPPRLEETLIISSPPKVISDDESSSTADINLQRAFKNYYRVQTLVIALGLIDLITCFFLDYPVVNRIGFYSSLIFQSTMVTLIPSFAYMVIRKVESCGDDDRFRKYSSNRFLLNFKILNIWSIVGVLYSIITTFMFFYDPKQNPFAGATKIIRLFDTYVLMGGLLPWMYLYASLILIRELSDAANNKKKRPTTSLRHGLSFFCFCCFPPDYETEGSAVDDRTAYYANVAAKDDQDLNYYSPV